MFEDINKELEELKQGMYRYEKIKTMLEALKDQQKQLEEKNKILEKDLDKEESDIEHLNKKSLTSIFYTILGSKEEQMEKERQEALAARLKLDDNIKQMSETRYQISKLLDERKNYENNERLFNNLYKKKYNLLKESSTEESQEILELEDRISHYKAYIKEVQEAILAGKRVMEQINSAESSLDSAEGWGTWDMFGGGLLTDMIKHSHIDDAKAAASCIQTLLNQFRTELADIKINSEIHIDIEGFAKFADFFFDGLISDWVIQSRINESLDSVRKVKDEVNNVLNKLEKLYSSVENNITECNEEIANKIERA
ncbi:hypothetical protein Ana3638_00200 [Anaerocolumna sedimenticola]|uniref:Uncharacterized protein n=1 Tax=Anaerocolumna sedimenticola TaxID=2696063 RepID=A0A6P1TG67_9FIRM|nr:hypothetical protein [Anaerocolumna sedimenticola]QHQ59413.1 hypothetical protein Ana3638_00200 [Anaerocolumna sedimenticola]